MAVPYRQKQSKAQNPGNAREKKAGVAHVQYQQRRYIYTRSAGQCEFEIEGVRCRGRGVNVAHIYGRPKCGKARDAREVVVHACKTCHDRWDGRSHKGPAVDVPVRFKRAAWDAILAASKLPLEVHIGAVGERP